MTHEDRIIAAIDRNTDRIVNAIRSSAVLIAFLLLLAGIIAKATPLLPPLDQPIIVEIGTPPIPPPNPNLQHWHTTYVPTDNGVYPLEVFAPVLPKIEFQRTSEPMVNTPEPGTLTVAGLSILGMMFLNLLLLNKSSKIVELTKALREANERNARYHDALKQIEDYGGFAPTVVIAQKALEEDWK